MVSAIQRSQSQLAATQTQLATGKKAADYATLGSDAIRTLSAHSLLARQDAQATVASQVTTTLSIQDSAMNQIESAVSGLKTQLLEAVGTGQTTGLQQAIEGAFHQFRTALNTTENGSAIFGGSQTEGDAFVPGTLQGVLGMSADQAFNNDQVKASGRVADGVDLSFGVVASEIGTGLFEAFKALAEAGPIDRTPTDAQRAALSTAIDGLGRGITQLQNVNADNGRKQAQVETLNTRAEQRAVLMTDIISRYEDADLSQVALDLSQRKSMLEASYSVFSQLSRLSLASYLR
jgi:flagellar hook-associated protein 3 FlgL